MANSPVIFRRLMESNPSRTTARVQTSTMTVLARNSALAGVSTVIPAGATKRESENRVEQCNVNVN